jgi:hypothetical protein
MEFRLAVPRAWIPVCASRNRDDAVVTAWVVEHSGAPAKAGAEVAGAAHVDPGKRFAQPRSRHRRNAFGNSMRVNG